MTTGRMGWYCGRYIISLLRERWRARQAGAKRRKEDMLDRIFTGIEVWLLLIAAIVAQYIHNAFKAAGPACYPTRRYRHMTAVA